MTSHEKRNKLFDNDKKRKASLNLFRIVVNLPIYNNDINFKEFATRRNFDSRESGMASPISTSDAFLDSLVESDMTDTFFSSRSIRALFFALEPSID
jgi:hypothetical protein